VGGQAGCDMLRFRSPFPLFFPVGRIVCPCPHVGQLSSHLPSPSCLTSHFSSLCLHFAHPLSPLIPPTAIPSTTSCRDSAPHTHTLSRSSSHPHSPSPLLLRKQLGHNRCNHFTATQPRNKGPCAEPLPPFFFCRCTITPVPS